MSDSRRERLTALRAASTPIPPSLQAKMAAFANRAHASPLEATTLALQQTTISDRPASIPSPTRSRLPGMASRRQKPSLNLRDIDPSIADSITGGGTAAAGLGAGRPTAVPDLSNSPTTIPKRGQAGNFGSPFSNFSKIVDPSGALNFNGKAILHASGVNFSNGSSFAINMDQLQLNEELGKGNYGTVKKVLHKPTNVAMAMKEIRLELDQAKLNAIIMELDVLHRAVAPEIVEFYGAFFIESCVYYCMEYMDAGSLDKLRSPPPHFLPSNHQPHPTTSPSSYFIPEPILGRVASSMTRGLKFLKDSLNIIHRDVKPTNVLVNRKGQVKLCDFGISGELDKSLAKTNIGCQSYMAPERIKGESQVVVGPGGVVGGVYNGTYTVSSDVWSLGLSMIEVGIGKYPYPPETYENVFAQLTAIVHGEPPELPEGSYSEEARDWVGRCLRKEPDRRASYGELLEHNWLVRNEEMDVDMAGWVERALEWRRTRLGAAANWAT